MTSTRTPSDERGTGPDRHPGRRAVGSQAPYRPRHSVPQAPVFVDRTGRRHRLLSTGGAIGAFALVAVTIGLAVALTGMSGGGLPGFPAAPEHSQQAPAHHTLTAATSTGTPATPSPVPDPSPNPTLSPSPTSSPSASPSQTTPGPPGRSNPHRHTPTSPPSKK
jgi:hypothetical protein